MKVNNISLGINMNLYICYSMDILGETTVSLAVWPHVKYAKTTIQKKDASVCYDLI